MSLNTYSSSVDLGALSWVKTEIEYSLAEVRSNLDKLAIDITDAKALKYVATHLHQVTGALSMLGLGAATKFSEEIEALVASLDDPANRAVVDDRVMLAKQATGSLSSYLDSLMSGEPDRPMTLAPAYLAVNRGRGENTATESDLFSPDLNIVVPQPENTAALPTSEMLVGAIKQRRSLYQAGLLKLLREKDFVAGAHEMRTATLDIEALQVASPTRAFWHTVGGFIDAVAGNPEESGLLAVHLFGKIDQQIKLLIQGVQKVPERLFRDLLLVIGKSTADSERIRTIRQLYRLDALLADVPLRDAASDQSVQTLVRSLRDQVQILKESWLKFTSGNRSALESFLQQGEVLEKTAQRLPNAAMAELLRVLVLVGPHLKKTSVAATETQALEVASALLFVDASLGHFTQLPPEFSAQTQSIISRIKGAMSGDPLPPIDVSTDAILDDFSKRAQERLLLFQVGQEVQVILSTIENTLDAFFRDPLKSAELGTLPPLFAKVQNALTLLGLDEATALTQILQDRVAQFSSGAVAGSGDAADAVAEGVSALGLFVSALQQSSADPRALLLPALIRFGLVEKLAETEPHLLTAPVSPADIEVDKQKVQALYSDWKRQPGASDAREQLRDAVLALKLNAEVAGDLDVASSSSATLKAIDSTYDPLKEGVTEAIADIAPVKPVEAPAQQTVQLLDAPVAEIDRELLDIFLEEAIEVLTTIRENHEVVRAFPLDRKALMTIRRGFHTLKGSGRMVGLMDLGDVAWSCEQVMNKWLKEEKPLTAGLLKLFSDATEAFSNWVSALQATGTVAIDGGPITAFCELLKNDQEPISEAVPSAQVAETATATAQIEPPVLAETEVFAEPPAFTIEEASGAGAVAQDPNVQIGDVTLPLALFEIYLGEANVHIETLGREMSAIEANPLSAVSHEFMRAAHTLNSSSRTTGFLSVAEIAFALEKWLQDAIELTALWDATTLSVTRDGVNALSGMIATLSRLEAPSSRPEVVAALVQLRSALQAGARTGQTSVEVANEGALPEIEQSTAQTTEDTAPRFDSDTDAAAPDEGASATDRAPTDTTLLPAIERIEPTAPVLTPETVFEIASTSALITAASTFAGESPDASSTATADVPSAPTGLDHTTAINPPTAIFEADEDRTVQDDVDTDLLPIFLEEVREITPQVGEALRRWRIAPANHGPVAELARHLHTLKGSARMAGLMRLGELLHAMETRVIDMDRVTEPKERDFEVIDDGLDRFNAAIERLAAGDLTPVIEISPEPPVAPDIPSESPSPMAAAAAEDEKLEGRDRQALLRVNADLLDRFVNEAGELAIARSRVALEVQAFKKALMEISDSVSRMKVQLREIEIGAETQIQSRIKEAQTQGEQFDPLEFDRFSRIQELTRFMAESLNDVVTLQQSLTKNLDEADAALLQQSRLNRDLQQGLMGARLVSLGNLKDRFSRLVRQAAKDLNKKANLEFRGVRVEIDRAVLEKITAPIEHLLRNAVAHGLETPADRVAAGKPEIGEIFIDARQIGNEVILTLADDGAGLDYSRIREKAIAKGMLTPDAEVTDTQLTQFIFAAGFTTAETVSQLFGRGVGMDVVRNEIASLGGRIDVDSSAGRGTTFTISLPLTLAVTQAVMVNVGQTIYAIPSVMIEQVQVYKGKRYELLLRLNEIEWNGNKYPLRSMEVMLGGKSALSSQRRAFVILAKSGQQRASVQVDDVIGNREIVVKSIGPQLARIPGITGATVLSSGQVVLIMNPVQLVFREAASISIEQNVALARVGESLDSSASMRSTTTTQQSRELVVPPGPTLAEAIAKSASDDGFMVDDPAQKTRDNPLVMVVDDSLTVRKITTRMLTRESFEVVTAKDGVDGLQQLHDVEPDVILLDIEMPRMDGFEFARNVRADPKTKHIPIIMITSRTADKHRNRAMELGVNEYMGKPYQEEQLLQVIRQFTGRRTGP